MTYSSRSPVKPAAAVPARALADYPLAVVTRWLAYHERKQSTPPPPAPAVVTPKSEP